MKILALVALLVSATPVLAQGDQLVFSANPKGSFEAGKETVDGSTGDTTFLHALTDSSSPIAELAIWRSGDEFRGKRVRISTRLKTQGAGRATCSLAAWNDSRALQTADGPIKAGSSDWTDCVVVMQIPDGATKVQIRYYLQGTGKVWADGFHIETVGADVPESRRINPNMTRNGDER